MIYGLDNIVENAVDFAATQVRIAASWTRREVRVVIADDGPGFPPHVLARLGEPYITTAQRGAPAAGGRDAAGGLGLGLFIAKALLERSGGAAAIESNAPPPDRGASVTIVWPLEMFEQGRQTSYSQKRATPVVSEFATNRSVSRRHGTSRRTLRPPAGHADLAAADKSLLIVDDDKPFRDSAGARDGGRAVSRRGSAVSVAEGLAADRRRHAPAFAVIDLKLGDGSGLDVMRALKAQRPDARAIILTGYGAIATAVVAVKLGAFDYLAKPVNADEIIAALMAGARRARRRRRASDVGRPRALGAHSARLRILRAQRLGDGAPAKHASPHAAAYLGQARPALNPAAQGAARRLKFSVAF